MDATSKSVVALIALAAIPRLIGIGYGLPHVYNADEPHVINMAVSLSASLRPYSFKYPTLWPTCLAGFYGLWFILWSGFGLYRGVIDFAARYAFWPTGFYLIARLLSTLCQLAALAVIAGIENREEASRWIFGAFFLAFSPSVVELAHAAKPESLLFLLVSASLAAALRHQREGSRRWLRLSAFLAGLACSTQYTAAPAALIVPAAWLLCAKGTGPLVWLVEAGGFALGGFLVGTPYALIDYHRFVANWGDYVGLGQQRAHSVLVTGRLVFQNIWCFGGTGSLSGAAALVGLFLMFRRDAKRALLLLAPIAVYAALLSASYDGAVPRYLIGAFPMLALFAGEGVAGMAINKRWLKVLVVCLLFGPGIALCWTQDADLLLPDTRAQAAQWLESHVPPGSTLLLDQPHAGPFTIMSREQSADLAERVEHRGSLRARLYRAMAARHPGGGYRVLRLQRSAADLTSGPRHVAQTQSEGDYLDVRPGLDVVRAARVDYVITSSYGADPRRARELATFFAELASQGELIQEFPSSAGVASGPWLRVFRLRR